MNHEVEIKNIEPITYLTRVNAAYFTHIGSYTAFSMAYNTISRHIQEKGLYIQTSRQKIIVKGPGMLTKGNSRSTTETLLPLNEGRRNAGN